MSKNMLCRCEDITVDDADRAMSDGYTCFEDLKRYLGVGTGPCQGKTCVVVTMQRIAAQTGTDPANLDVMTFRPPLRPMRFDLLAGEDA